MKKENNVKITDGEDKPDVNKPSLANSRNLKLLQKRNAMNQTENFSDLQPNIEISNSAIINAVRSESYRDTRWKVWLKAAQHYWGADGEGKEILEVLHLGSQVIGLM